jgi:hypothetical protein
VIEVVCVERIFRRVIIPPNIGSKPYGSGALKSLNQKNPSVKIAGFKS